MCRFNPETKILLQPGNFVIRCDFVHLLSA